TKGLDDEKIQFSKEIKELEKKLNQNIELESFILSKTPYEQLKKGIKSPPSKNEYIEHHVLFLEDSSWVEDFFKHLRLPLSELS
ncbi:MAG: hypothetical protein N2712_08000, partial [Brevinematales bacterium]|nr:hypothetical protein [Brevinematales bacterium]